MNVNSDIGMGEDGACSTPLICNCNSMFLMPECLYYYRLNTSSLTKVKKPLSWDNYDKVFECYKKGMGQYYSILKEQIFRHRCRNIFKICVSQFYEDNRSYSDTVSCIKKRFKEHPEYEVAIENAKFKSTLMKLEKFILSHKLYSLLYIISKLKP